MDRWILIIIVLMTFAMVSTANAKKLYKYQDEKGQWHFSDQRPDTTQPLETQQLYITERKTKVSLRNRGTRTQPVYYGVNEYHGPVEVEIRLTAHQNITTNPELPARFIIPAVRETALFKLWPTQKNQSWSYKLSYRFTPGNPNAQHRPPKPYRLPFEKGESFRISQAFHGPYSHNHPQSEYAVDIVMPEGTRILAARDGLVMDAASDFFTGGTDKEKHLNRANVIRILHDDGTMAVYGHLSLETAQVSPGMKVYEGQLIAESGNTGFSSGPHLHFVIQKNEGMHLVSVPFQFENNSGQAITPSQGMLLGDFQ